MNGVHDMGGTHGYGPVTAEIDEPVFHAPWEGRIYAILRLLLGKGVLNADEFRYAIESLPPVKYLSSAYYERVLAGVEHLVAASGTSTSREVSQGPPEIPAFKVGTRVLVRNSNPQGHTRVPRYVRGKHGVVESIHGPYRLPDTHAHYLSDDWQPVYTVVFEGYELWGRDAEPGERLSIDLWQAYLDADDR